MYLAGPTGSDVTLLTQQEEEKDHSVIAQPMGDCHNSENEKSLYLEISVSSKGLFVYNSLF